MRVVPVTLSGASGQKVTDFGINSGGNLLLQNCQNMPGQRVVVNGEVEVTLGQRVIQVRPNESLYNLAGKNDRLANPGAAPAAPIEAQVGSSLGEDDVNRLGDVYNRPATETEAVAAAT